MNNKRTIILLVLSILVVISITVGVTYAYLSISDNQENANTLTTTCYDLTFTDSNIINITSYPMSDSKGLSLAPYNFSLRNDCEVNTEYQVILNVMNNTSSNILPYIKYSLDGVTVNKLASLTPITLPSGVSSANVSSSYVIDMGNIAGISNTKSFNLHMWIDENAGNDIMGSVFEARINVYSVAR